MTRTRSIIAGALLLGVAAPASAQSLFATRGLGVPVYGVDARAASLGGIGVGLFGFHTSMVNPAELTGLTRRGVSAALQPLTSTTESDGVTDETSGTRFPLIRILYPLSPRFVASLGYGAYLDQGWGVITESEQQIGGQTVAVTDLLRSVGGIAQLRLSGAYALSPTLSLGASAGLLTGSVDRIATRTFEGGDVPLAPFEERNRWRFSAPIGVVGMRWDAARSFRIGASAMVGGDLSARTDDDADDRDYGAPLELTAGASARLSPLLMATAGATWSRPPAVGGETVSAETMRFGGGLEYQGVRSGVRAYPIRLGVRWAELPYHAADETQPTEWGASFGLGFRLGDPTDPAAVADFGVERSARSGLAGGAVNGGVDEQLWRFTFSLSLFAR